MDKQKMYRITFQLNDIEDNLIVMADSEVSALHEGLSLLEMVGIHAAPISVDLFA